MRIQFLLAAVISLSVPGGMWAAPAEAADLDDVSVRLFKMQQARAERERSAQAQYYLAQMYDFGLGTPEDNEKAREWYKRAADQGLAVAKLQLQELKRAEQEEKVDLQRAAGRTKAGAQASNPAVQSGGQSVAAGTAVVDDAARRAAREKARAERKRRAMEALRKATAAAVAVDPFE
jgi:TPR repeat protein